ncbi:GntR family transcriptional regulator [Tropicimonas sediminicola]|uniref:DNA-binding transcriptional regulator, GntR family n=1 Tax=Tropicimonas sediminicola TaxID=1031541 RepID=A0A239LIF4_9RHOB|nr:GntR family transcriptional regulator [Tropicimonas sediminicola]SNT30457.1 DNA-binding transcriptional regulator, GntR family [Tropicimonas sediminicola]
MNSEVSRSGSKPTRASNVSTALKRAILEGRLEPGEKVNLDRLRSEHGVSLSPMREAISRLVADWLVVFEDQRGYRIAPISAENLAEVTRMRADMEALALGRAIAVADLEWESRVMADQHRLSRASDDDSAQAAMRLHSTLIEGCGMPMLQEVSARLADLHRRYGAILGHVPADAEREALGAVATSAVARDAELAPAMLRRHIERHGAALAARLPATSKRQGAEGGRTRGED